MNTVSCTLSFLLNVKIEILNELYELILIDVLKFMQKSRVVTVTWIWNEAPTLWDCVTKVISHNFGVPHLVLLLFRAATLVRRTKGENRRGRSLPLRCDRQRWYGGTRGRGHRGVSGEATPHAVTTPGHHTRHTPPHQPRHHIHLLPLPVFSQSLTYTTYSLQWWTDLCMSFTELSWINVTVFFCMTWGQRDNVT